LSDFPDFEEFSKQAGKRRFKDIFENYEEFSDIEDDEMWEELI
jgi:hypothetical protein